MNHKRLSIIIPVFNEGQTVGLVIDRLLKVNFPQEWIIEVIVVNDGSTDTTASVLDRFSSKIKVIHLIKNSGKGSAVKAGIEASTGDYAIIQDADLECAPEEIALLLKPLENIALEMKIAVMGSRELNKRGRGEESQFLSRLGSLAITKLINILYGSSLTDALMGYKLFPRATFGYFVTGRFEAEMIFITKLLKEGYKIVEVPVSYNPRTVDAGKKIRYFDGIKIIVRIVYFWATGR